MTDLRMRIVEGSLDKWTKGFLQEQVRNSTVETLRLTDAACDILTSLAGIRNSRRRQWLWSDLEEIVNGQLPGGDGEYTDYNTAAFGQLLGPLLAILRADSGGAWEVIRVLEEPSNEKRPDFILINRRNDSIIVHECKGVSTDCDKVRKLGKFDLCEKIHRQYDEGQKKLIKSSLHPEKWELRQRLTLVGDGQVLPFPTNKLLVSIAAISDGRLGALNPPPRHVSGCGLPCTQRCVANGTNGIIVAALAEKTLDGTGREGEPGLPRPNAPQFPLLEAYKACERAIWQGSGSALGSAYAGLLSATLHADHGDDAITHSTDFLISPLEAAAVQGVAIDMREALTMADEMRLPESFRDALQYWAHRFPSEMPEPPKEMDISQLGQILSQYGEDSPSYTRGAEWVIRDSKERHVHLRLTPTPAGRLARLSPRETVPSPSEGAYSMLGTSAELLSATLRMEMPAIKEMFTSQTVSLNRSENSLGKASSFQLGWSLFPTQDRGMWRELLHHLRHSMRRGIRPGPWGLCPRHPFIYELWWDAMHHCLHCGHHDINSCWWPWFFPFRTWVSYDGRAEMWLP